MILPETLESARRKKGLAWIMPIGNELLIGRIVDTNSAWIARRLTFLGYRVYRIVKVPDSLSEIKSELLRALEYSEVIITTGGLGPTYDDITLEAIAATLGRDLVLNDEAYSMVKNFYEQRGMPITPERRKMAMLPEGAKPIPNPVGAAPGALIELHDSIIVALPGVPSEMKAMFTNYVESILSQRAPPRRYWECHIEIAGIPESSLAPLLENIARKHPRSYIKSHPKGHELEGPVIELRILSSGDTEEEAKWEAEVTLNELKKGLGGFRYRIRQEGCGPPG